MMFLKLPTVSLLILITLAQITKARLLGDSRPNELNNRRRTTKSIKVSINHFTKEEDELAVHVEDFDPDNSLRTNDLHETTSSELVSVPKCASWCTKKAKVLARKKEWSLRKAMCDWKVCSSCGFRFCPKKHRYDALKITRKFKCKIVEDENLGFAYQNYDVVHANLDCSCCRTGDTKSCCVPFES